jgi:quercetin dioxygenase-like cupin family protein
MFLVSAGRKIMKPSNILCGVLLSALGVAIGANLPHAADAPTGNKGLATGKTTSVDLGREFPGMEGRQLRLRVLTIEPGGYIGLHSHKDRPTVGYFLQGTDTAIRDDGSSQTFKPGDVNAEPGSTIHWHRNDGKDQVIPIVADVFKP